MFGSGALNIEKALAPIGIITAPTEEESETDPTDESEDSDGSDSSGDEISDEGGSNSGDLVLAEVAEV